MNKIESTRNRKTNKKTKIGIKEFLIKLNADMQNAVRV